jgi:hypothetical protein
MTIDCPEVDFRIKFRVSTLIMIHIDRGLSGCKAGDHSRYFQGVARCEPDTGWKPMLCYTAPSRGWLWARGTPVRKHFQRSLDTPESNVA